MILQNEKIMFSTKQRTICLGLFCCLMGCFAFAADKPSIRLVIPGGPPDVYLGMPLKELLAQRKNIKKLAFFDTRPIDPESKRGMLYEEYKNTQFQNALYFIQDGKLLVLCAASEYQGKVPTAVRKKFLSDVVRAYGQPDGATVVVDGAAKYDYNIPALFWHLSTATVAVAITPDKIGLLEPTKSVIEFKLFAPEYIVDGQKTPTNVPFDVSKIPKEQQDKILAPLREAVQQTH